MNRQYFRRWNACCEPFVLFTSWRNGKRTFALNLPFVYIWSIKLHWMSVIMSSRPLKLESSWWTHIFRSGKAPAPIRRCSTVVQTKNSIVNILQEILKCQAQVRNSSTCWPWGIQFAHSIPFGLKSNLFECIFPFSFSLSFLCHSPAFYLIQC